ncbi:MAG: hypothetical protein K2X60_13015 [Xanthobacteraceae bacterium]|nr:hypothetical protein [Xanthobacteraceae bacterium]
MEFAILFLPRAKCCRNARAGVRFVKIAAAEDGIFAISMTGTVPVSFRSRKITGHSIARGVDQFHFACKMWCASRSNVAIETQQVV